MCPPNVESSSSGMEAGLSPGNSAATFGAELCRVWNTSSWFRRVNPVRDDDELSSFLHLIANGEAMSGFLPKRRLTISSTGVGPSSCMIPDDSHNPPLMYR